MVLVAADPVESLTIDLANATFVDSAGISALDQLRTLTAEHASPFALAAVPRCAQRVLEITTMDGLFTYR